MMQNVSFSWLVTFLLFIIVSSTGTTMVYKVSEQIFLEETDIFTHLMSLNFTSSESDEVSRVQIFKIEKDQYTIDNKMVFSFSLEYLLHTPVPPLLWALTRYRIDYTFSTPHREFKISSFLDMRENEDNFTISTDEKNNLKPLENLFRFRVLKIYDFYKKQIINPNNLLNFLNVKYSELNAQQFMENRLEKVVLEFLITLTADKINQEVLFNHVLERLTDIYISVLKEKSKDTRHNFVLKLLTLSNEITKKCLMIFINDMMKDFDMIMGKYLNCCTLNQCHQDYSLIEYNKFKSVKTFKKVIYIDIKTFNLGEDYLIIIFYDENNEPITHNVNYDVLSGCRLIITHDELQSKKISKLYIKNYNTQKEGIILYLKNYL